MLQTGFDVSKLRNTYVFYVLHPDYYNQVINMNNISEKRCSKAGIKYSRNKKHKDIFETDTIMYKSEFTLQKKKRRKNQLVTYKDIFETNTIMY